MIVPMMDADSHSAARLTSSKGWLLAALCMAYGSSAVADTASGVMTVSATVATTCVVGTSTLAFGSASSAAIQAGNLDATGTVTVNCTTGSSYTIALAAGGGTGATLASRKMSAGTNLLNYSIYTSAARTTVWGDGTLASATTPGTGSGTSQSVIAYGRIFAGQTVPAGAYTDTVTVTVTY
jgi:spore coat protein U-like protein